MILLAVQSETCLDINIKTLFCAYLFYIGRIMYQ